MSWSVGLKKPVLKADAKSEIDVVQLDPSYDSNPDDVKAGMQVQLSACKEAAKKMLAGIGQPYIMFSASGHVEPSGGSGSDSCSANIYGVNESNLSFYK